ncbi:hypothetical protein [Hymenobacter cellulosivorans]|uniref:Uncharacterized protein n=1 Tax=Hymenobacter cellulosivorans TaxID=2932249 RepID=A0ABY4F492_9BACT|nr:hypothetical protein [Hymenobacter cellulosivorans]UOQ50982.1 hypothetical protein MUN80_14575 [Hymenobacter cellulosivorans]
MAPEENSSLEATRVEADELRRQFYSQQDRLEALLAVDPQPVFTILFRITGTLIHLLGVESGIIAHDFSSFARYHKPNKNWAETQAAVGNLDGGFTMKGSVYRRIISRIMQIQDEDRLDVYAATPDYPRMVALCTQLLATENVALYHQQLKEAQAVFKEHVTGDPRGVSTYRLPIPIDFAALRQTTIGAVRAFAPVHELARLILPLNETLLAEFEKSA